MPIKREPPELLQGTLDLLILKTLRKEPLHGWAIAQRIRRVSEDVLRIRQGSLYPALHRLDERGWIRSHWGKTHSGRRARIYELTPTGEKQLASESADWVRLSSAVNRVLLAT